MKNVSDKSMHRGMILLSQLASWAVYPRMGRRYSTKYLARMRILGCCRPDVNWPAFPFLGCSCFFVCFFLFAPPARFWDEVFFLYILLVFYHSISQSDLYASFLVLLQKIVKKNHHRD